MHALGTLLQCLRIDSLTRLIDSTLRLDSSARLFDSTFRLDSSTRHLSEAAEHVRPDTAVAATPRQCSSVRKTLSKRPENNTTQRIVKRTKKTLNSSRASETHHERTIRALQKQSLHFTGFRAKFCREQEDNYSDLSSGHTPRSDEDVGGDDLDDLPPLQANQ